MGYGGKKVYNKYIRDPQIKIISVSPKIEPKKVELSIDSIVNEIQLELSIGIVGEDYKSTKMRKIYGRIIKVYKNQKGDKFQKVVEKTIPEDKKYDEQFITWFQELDNEALEILLKDFTNEEKTFIKSNFKFYSYVWVCGVASIVLAFALKDKKIDLNEKKGVEECKPSTKFGYFNYSWKNYRDILKYCEIDKK